MVGQRAGPQRVPVGLASGSSLAGSAWLAFVLAWVWLAFLRNCFDFGLISSGFCFRLSFTAILIGFGLILIDFDWILLDFGWISA